MPPTAQFQSEDPEEQTDTPHPPPDNLAQESHQPVPEGQQYREEPQSAPKDEDTEQKSSGDQQRGEDIRGVDITSLPTLRHVHQCQWTVIHPSVMNPASLSINTCCRGIQEREATSSHQGAAMPTHPCTTTPKSVLMRACLSISTHLRGTEPVPLTTPIPPR